ncbi:MAG: OmpH family outer membrane protein [Bacteroidales bacterium]
MNFIPRILLATILLLASAGFSLAQAQKLGHINTSNLLQIMPGRDTAQAALEKHARSLQNDLQEYQKEFQTKYEKYMSEEESMPRLMKETRQEELMQMEERIRKYQENAQKELQEKEQQLLQPILERAQEAIDEVAEEEGYTYILDTSTGAVVYIGDKGKDIMPRVRKKLDIEDVPIPDEEQQLEMETPTPTPTPTPTEDPDMDM